MSIDNPDPDCTERLDPDPINIPGSETLCRLMVKIRYRVFQEFIFIIKKECGCRCGSCCGFDGQIM